MANTFTSVDIAIAIGRQLGLFLLPGSRVPGYGNCFILALLTQMLDRREVFGLPDSQDVQEWREYLVGIRRISTEARMNVEMIDRDLAVQMGQFCFDSRIVGVVKHQRNPQC